MFKKYHKKLVFCVPVIALIVITFQVVMVKTNQLSRWKGGGFGMYSEIHHGHNEIWLKHKTISIDSLAQKNKRLNASIKRLKAHQTKNNLKTTAKLIQKLTQYDTIVLQVWKPKIDVNKATYYRTLASEITYIN